MSQFNKWTEEDLEKYQAKRGQALSSMYTAVEKNAGEKVAARASKPRPATKHKKEVKPVPSESLEQQAVIEWFRRTYPQLHLIAYPSGMWFGHSDKLKYALINKAKREGWLSGVSDLFLCHSDGQHHGLWLEMKKQGATASSVSKQQKQWLVDMEKAGYVAKWAYGAERAKDIIKDYINSNYFVT